jgi:hypothetical protein
MTTTVTPSISGADVIGVNCKFDPPESLKAVAKMKEGLEKAGLKAHMMFQPLGFHCPDADNKSGYLTLPEYPFGKIRSMFRASSFHL